MKTFRDHPRMIDIMKKLREQRIVLFQLNETELFDISLVQPTLDELNSRLLGKCSNLSLRFDYIFNYNDSRIKTYYGPIKDTTFLVQPLLCLMKDGNCVSNIIFRLKDASTVEISSLTDENNQRKKYNILLRSIALMICPLLEMQRHRIRSLYSLAQNYVSALLLMQTFEVTVIDENDDAVMSFIDFQTRYPTLSLKEQIEKAYKSNDTILGVKVNCSDHNLSTAHQLFESLTDAKAEAGVRCI